MFWREHSYIAFSTTYVGYLTLRRKIAYLRRKKISSWGCLGGVWGAKWPEGKTVGERSSSKAAGGGTGILFDSVFDAGLIQI